MRRSLFVWTLVLLSAGARAQLTAPDPDWKEAAPPPPPVLQTSKLVPVPMTGSLLRWGVDPASISIGADRVVRYVVVASADGGATTALYEGLRCDTAEVKLYMRNVGGQWVPATGADWKPLHGNSTTRHSLLIARNGACIGHGANSSASQIARDLGASPEYQFRREAR